MLNCKRLLHKKGAVLYVDFGPKLTKKFKLLSPYVGNIVFHQFTGKKIFLN